MLLDAVLSSFAVLSRMPFWLSQGKIRGTDRNFTGTLTSFHNFMENMYAISNPKKGNSFKRLLTNPGGAHCMDITGPDVGTKPMGSKPPAAIAKENTVLSVLPVARNSPVLSHAIVVTSLACGFDT